MSATPNTYTAFEAWATTSKPWWIVDLSRYEGERYRHEETWKAFEAFAAGRGSVGAPAAPVAWRKPDDTANVPKLVWLREKGRVFLGYYFVQRYSETRDLDGRYIDHADADEYWCRYEDGDACQPDGWCELTPPAIAAAEAAQPEPAPTRADLIAALKFYADGAHFDLSDDTAWDTVSGEPQNWWCDEVGTATIEDGTIAAQTLAGKLTAEQIKAMDEGEEFADDDPDATPAQPEPAAVHPSAPAQGTPLTAWITEGACEVLQRGEGPVRAMPFENEETGFTVALSRWPASAPAAQAAPVQAVPLTDAARDVLAERRRQVEVEGWTPEHDDQHGDGSMALAAACYAAADPDGRAEAPPLWPWDPEWWKSGDERRNLVKAGALILAEIERLDRATHGITGDKQHGTA